MSGGTVPPQGQDDQNGLALGGAVRGGLYGDPPNLARLDAAGNMGFGADYRSLYATVLERWWRLNSREVLGAPFAPPGFVA